MIDILSLFKRQDFTERPPERQTLVLPVHERIDEPESQPVLEAAAQQVVMSKLVWRWPKYDGTSRLCRWDSAQKVFLQGSLNDWIYFIAENWHVRDANGVEYLGPSPVIMDRLLQKILAHPELPTASWALQLQRRREGK